MKKANANATERKPSGAVDSDPTPEKRPVTSSGDGSDAMTADEMAVFEKIIGEIEGQAQSSVENATPDAENRHEPSGGDLRGLPSASSQAPDDEQLDVEQQKAFESIMAQIEGTGGGHEAKAEPAEPLPVDSKNESDAELELVSRESDRVVTEASAVEPGEKADDELDAEQQKAFESIMAQIEGTGGDKVDAGAPSADSTEDAETDDFAAELEKVARESEAIAVTESKDNPADASGGDLDEAQPKDAASIINAVAGQGERPPTKPVERTSETAHQPATTSDSAAAEEEEEAHDISDDIDDLLREITSDEDDSDAAPASAVAENDSESHVPSDDTIIVQPGEDVQPETKATPSPDASAERAGIQRKKPAVRITQRRENTEDDTTFIESGTPKKVAPLHESRPAAGVKKKKGLMIFGLIFLVLAPAGYYYRLHAVKQGDYSPPSPVIQQTLDMERKPDERPRVPVAASDEPSDQMRLKSVAEEIDRMRDELIAKQSEIKELRDYYQAGIEVELQNIVDIRNQMDNSPVSYKTAMTDTRISLGLSAIQRRDAYIKKLAQPVHSLNLNSEELLFLSRKAELLGVMAGKTSDIDTDGFLKQAKETIAAHRHGLTQLNIDAVDVPSVSLESIWQQIDSRMPKKPIVPASSPAGARTQVTAIGEEICSGNFTHRDKLTVLTPEVARCLAAWKGKDLYLNELNDLSPEAARELADWEGDWLGLNGLEALSPETARHLSRWKGKGLSLNGLSRLSPQVVAILSEWQGDQIELVNVNHMVHWENPKTRLFLSEKMKRKPATRGTQP